MLEHALNDLSHRIYEAKHNDRYRFSYRQKERGFEDRGRAYGGHWRSKGHERGPRDYVDNRG